MKWIPIDDDQRPQCGQYVLVSFANYHIPMVAKYMRDGDGGFFGSASGINIIFLGFYANAWMPLPDPYREEEL